MSERIERVERVRALSWLASLCAVTGQIFAAESYLLELLAWCALADRAILGGSEPS